MQLIFFLRIIFFKENDIYFLNLIKYFDNIGYFYHHKFYKNFFFIYQKNF
jgi:hypothetical protein